VTEPPSGLVIVDKQSDWTSHDVVARLRRTLGTRKVGHAGTLDPMATGVLVVGFGRATRLLGHLMMTEKTYVATVRLGVITSTDDADGEVLAITSAEHVGEAEVRAELAAQVGEIDQVPSSVSAIKVDGKRAYTRVREGEDVELSPRRVTIHEAEAGEFRRDGDALEFELRVRCSSGTYIRAISRDIGAALGVGGHLTALRRTSVGPFTLDDAQNNTDLDHVFVTSIDDAARRAFPTVALDDAQATDVRFGRPQPGLALGSDGPVALCDSAGHFLALYEQRGDEARAVAVFADPISGTA
jgi:tRNA pseudouridine55 synthase